MSEHNYNTESDKDLKDSPLDHLGKSIRGGYEIPSCYFDDLKSKVMASVGENKKVTTWRDTIKSAAGFVAGFAAMVLFAVGIVHLTPQESIDELATVKESNSQYELEEFMILYQVSEDDVLAYVFPEEDSQTSSSLSENTVIDYVQFYGGVDNY